MVYATGSIGWMTKKKKKRKIHKLVNGGRISKPEGIMKTESCFHLPFFHTLNVQIVVTYLKDVE